MSSAHYFRANDFEWIPGLIGFLVASGGLALLMKVPGLRRSGRRRFALGFLAGISFYSIVLYWIVIALEEFGELHWALAVSIAFLLWSYCAAYFGVWAWISGHPRILSKSVGLRILLWASAWAGLEAIREHLFTGFNWGEIGFHFAYWPSLAQSASFWGVHGLSFVWIFFVGTLLHLDEWWEHSGTRRFIFGSWIVLVAVFATTWLGARHLETLTSTNLRVALIQPNVSQELKWSAEKASDHLRQLVDMTSEASVSAPDLIIWPETAYPFLVQLSQNVLPFSSSIPVIVGAVVGERGINRNSALLVEGDQIRARFDKIHLVPFGEFVPFEDWMPFEKLVANVGRFLHGAKDQPLLHLNSRDVSMGPLVCYEDAFSRHSVRHAKKGARLLVNMTNDGWYGRSSALRQHADIASLQVYSTQIPMIRATNTGLSSVITPNQRTDFPEFEKSVIPVEVPIYPKEHESIYVKTYPLMQWIWWLLFAIALLWKSRDPKRKIFINKSLH